jgi:hypothetical protein
MTFGYTYIEFLANSRDGSNEFYIVYSGVPTGLATLPSVQAFISMVNQAGCSQVAAVTFSSNSSPVTITCSNGTASTVNDDSTLVTEVFSNDLQNMQIFTTFQCSMCSTTSGFLAYINRS